MSFERRKTKIGTVLSDKMDRSVVVQTEWKNIHRLYKKAMRRTAKLTVHDPENICGIGDVIEVIEDRPRSKNKRWRLLNVIKKNDQDDLNLDNILTGESLLEIDESEPEPEAESEPEPQPEVESESESEPKAESESAPEPKVESEPEPEVESEKESKQ